VLQNIWCVCGRVPSRLVVLKMHVWGGGVGGGGGGEGESEGIHEEMGSHG